MPGRRRGHHSQATGEPVDTHDVTDVKQAVDLPILIGSIVTPATVPILLQHADALIVGSALKVDGHWSNEMDPSRLDAIVSARV